MKNINTFKSLLVFVITFFIFSSKIKASGTLGAQITYRLIDSNYGKYKLTLEVYRSCNSIAFGGEELQIMTSTGTNIAALTLVSKDEVTPIGLPPDVLSPIATNCPFGAIPASGIKGMERATYETNYVIGKNIGWVCVAWTSCCRETGLNTVFYSTSSSLWVQAAINTSYVNNSPIYTGSRFEIWGTNRENYYSISANDYYDTKYINIGGKLILKDSLAYELIAPMVASASNFNSIINLQNPSVTYQTGINAQNFIYANSPPTLNPQTGIISATPSVSQSALLCFVVKEYRAVPNGSGGYSRVYIGHTMRDVEQNVKDGETSIFFNGIIKDSSRIDSLKNAYTATTCAVKNKIMFKVIGTPFVSLKIKDQSTISLNEISGYNMTYKKTNGNNVDTMYVTLTYDKIMNVPRLNFQYKVFYVSSVGLMVSRYIPIIVEQGNGFFNLAQDTAYLCNSISATSVRLDATLGGIVKWSPKSYIVAAQPIDSGWIDVNPPSNKWYYADNLSSNQTCKFKDSIYVQIISCDTVAGYLYTDADKNCIYNAWEFAKKYDTFIVKGVTNSYVKQVITDTFGHYFIMPPLHNSYIIERNGYLFNCSANKIQYSFALTNRGKNVNIPIKDSAVISFFNNSNLDSAFCANDSIDFKYSFYKNYSSLRIELKYGDGNLLSTIFDDREGFYTFSKKYKYSTNGTYYPKLIFYNRLNKAYDSINLNTISIRACLKGKVFFDSISNCTFDTTTELLAKYYHLYLLNKSSNVQTNLYTNDQGEYFTHYNTSVPYEMRNSLVIHCNSNQAFKSIPVFSRDTNLILDFPLDISKTNYTIIVNKKGKISNTTQISLDLTYGGYNLNHSIAKTYIVTLPSKASFASISNNATYTLSGNTINITQNSGTLTTLGINFSNLVSTDTLCFGVKLVKVAPETDTSDNELNFCNLANDIYQNNSKNVSIPSQFTHEDFSEKMNPLFYTLNFQNKSNSTVKNVRLIDNLDAKLDENTLEILSSSHPMKVTLLGKILYVDFNNINLPDSSSNEPASHGFVNFKINPIAAIKLGDEIKNKVDIILDTMPSTSSNTVISRYSTKPKPKPEDSTNVSIRQLNEAKVSITPNPTKDLIYINFKDRVNQYNIAIYSLDGKLVYTQQNRNTIDISNLGKGFYFLKLSTAEHTQEFKIQKE